MKVTIGELIEFILPFSNQITFLQSHDRFYLHANIISISNYRKFTLYIAQMDEHEYAVLDTDGSHVYYPHDSDEKPFIMDQDLVRQQYGSGYPSEEWYEDMKFGITSDAFMEHFMDLLIRHEVVSYKKESGSLVFIEMGINSDKVKRAIKKAFKDQGYPDGTIDDLIDIIHRKGERFWLRGCGPKELQFVCKKLKTIGLIATVEQDFITKLEFERR